MRPKLFDSYDKVLTLIYCALSVLHIALRFTENLSDFTYVSTKTAPLITIVIWLATYKFRFMGEVEVFKMYMMHLSALVFCIIGDLVVEIDDAFFDLAIATFMAAHVFFILFYRTFKDFKLNKYIPHWAAFGITIYLYFHFNIEPDLRLPIFLYVTIFIVMLWHAHAIFIESKSLHSLWILIGTMMFAVSDIVVGATRLFLETNLEDVLGMLLYYGAQLFILYGFLGLIKDKYRQESNSMVTKVLVTDS